MHVRSVGATGLKVSRLGLGTMTWGRDTDEHEARDQLIAFAEAGGTLLDTAAGYGDGASESAVATSTGITASTRRTGCHISAYALAGEGDETQTGGGYSVGRSPTELDLEEARLEV